MGSTVERGRLGEQLAAEALEAHGYCVIECNWRCPAGEIDIVARDGDTTVFVEVKLRQGEAFGQPEEGVTVSKRARLISAGSAYMAAHGLLDSQWRIDLVAIALAPDGLVQRLAIYQDAVVADG
jgi:putative endonuclease